MRQLCTVGVAASLTPQSTLADELSGNHPLTPQARDAFVTDLLGKMTVDEKVGQLRLISAGPGNPKEMIRGVIKDGQVGAISNTATRPDIHVVWDRVMQLSRLKTPLFFTYDALHGQRTVFPINLGLASSFSLDAVKTIGRISAYETVDDGLNMTWVLVVDVSRGLCWGRASEGLGGDTYLTTMMGQAMVESMQGKSPADRYPVMTNAKRFAAYGAVEGGEEYNTADISSQRLFNDHMLLYKAGLNVDSGTVMAASNSLDGIPVTADSRLLKGVLRGQWGFKNITISDRGATKELIRHDVVPDLEDTARVAPKPGINMSMNDEYYNEYLPGLVKSGRVITAKLDDATHRVLNVKHDMELFNDPYGHLGPKDSNPQNTNAENRLHYKEAQEVTHGSLVLLKSCFNTPSLKRSDTIAVAGALASSKRDMMGSWSVVRVADQSVTVLTGVKEALGDNDKVIYTKGANVTDGKGIVDFLNPYEEAVQVDPCSPQGVIDEAVAAAKQSDVVVAVVDEAQGTTHKASSRTDVTLPQSQRSLIATLRVTGKSLVLMLINGRPLASVKEDRQVDTLLETQFAGTEGGHVIIDVPFGGYNPSDKLPIFFPRPAGQIPVYYSHLSTGRLYNSEKPNKYTLRYLDEANGPLYPFGYGLSHITFSVSDATISLAALPRDGSVTAGVQMTNAGKREGTAVTRLYLQDIVTSTSRPMKTLCGFEKVNLKPGETQTVSSLVDVNALKFWNQQMKYVAESGKFNVFTNVDSARVKQSELKLL